MNGYVLEDLGSATAVLSPHYFINIFKGLNGKVDVSIDIFIKGIAIGQPQYGIAPHSGFSLYFLCNIVIALLF